MDVRSGGGCLGGLGEVPVFEVFCVQKCIVVHFSRTNIELLVSDTCIPAMPWTKTVPLGDARNTNSSRD